MNEQERQKMAQHLAGMSYKRARAEIRRLDTAANLKYWRNAIHNEWHTAYELPSIGLKITLVEKPDRQAAGKIDIFEVEKVTPVYVEARVEPLTTPHK
jgi:hypothetical protein